MATKNYDEYIAKSVLESFFPNLKPLIISDKPDLRTVDGRVGIEVTNCLPQETMHFYGDLTKINETKNQSSKNICIKAFEKKYQVDLSKPISHPLVMYNAGELKGNNPALNILDAFNKKLDKLNWVSTR